MNNAPAPPPAVPRHIGIIMDGNGRWAAQRGLPREVGHRAGARTVRRITEAAARLGLRQLTLYAFSSENWLRPAHEVATLMKLFARHLRSERPRLVRHRIAAVFDNDRLPVVLPDIGKGLRQYFRLLGSVFHQHPLKFENRL